MPRVVSPSGLTDKQRMFVAEYVCDKNATQAAIRAGYSRRTASVIGKELLSKPRIKAAIEQALKDQQQRVETNADEVLREIIRLAMLDPAEVVHVRSPEDIKALPEDIRRAIVGWKWDRQGRFMIELAKGENLERLAKHFGLYEADNEQRAKAAPITRIELVAMTKP